MHSLPTALTARTSACTHTHTKNCAQTPCRGSPSSHSTNSSAHPHCQCSNHVSAVCQLRPGIRAFDGNLDLASLTAWAVNPGYQTLRSGCEQRSHLVTSRRTETFELKRLSLSAVVRLRRYLGPGHFCWSRLIRSNRSCLGCGMNSFWPLRRVDPSRVLC